MNPNEQPAPQPTPMPMQQPAPTPQSAPQQFQSFTPAEPTAPTKKSNKTVIIILCAIIGIIAIVAVVMVILLNKQPQEIDLNNIINANNITNNTPNTSNKNCGNDQKIIGIWKQKDEDLDGLDAVSSISYVFKSDGTGVIITGAYNDTQFVGVEFTYSITCTELQATQYGIKSNMELGLTDTDMSLSGEGITIYLKRVSSDPDDAPDYIIYDSSANNYNTQRRYDLAKVMNQLNAYYSNNCMYPKTQSAYEDFFKKYLTSDGGDDFEDPDGNKYIPTLAGKCK